MMLILIRDGGTVVIGDSQINTWQHIYPYIDVKKVITKLDKKGMLKNYTSKGVLKVINYNLNNENKKKEGKYV